MSIKGTPRAQWLTVSPSLYSTPLTARTLVMTGLVPLKGWDTLLHSTGPAVKKDDQREASAVALMGHYS